MNDFIALDNKLFSVMEDVGFRCLVSQEPRCFSELFKFECELKL